MKNTDKVRWVIQNNLIAENDLNQLQEACKDIGTDIEEVLIVPFTNTLPKFTPGDNNVYYGSTTFMNNVYKNLNPKGLFYDDKEYTMENYINQWGDHMLSSEARFVTIDEFLLEENDPDGNWFIRPNGDGKEFDGQVAKFKNIQSWMNRVMQYDVNLDGNSIILVGPAYNIYKEWRNYVVGGEIVTSSMYRKDFKLSKSSTDIPEEMLAFARERMKEYMPHENFAMDICSLHDGTYYIIECGCLNSVGFYHADISKIVTSVTKWMENE
jgi:hypothetical protein